MAGVRRTWGTTLLCALSLLLSAAPAHASDGLLEREVLRDVLRPPVAAAGRPQALPLPEPGPFELRAQRQHEPSGARRGSGSRAAATAAERDASIVPRTIARAAGRERVLVGARTHEDVPRLRARLRELGASVQTVDALGVLSADVPSGTALAQALHGDPGVAYVERDRILRQAADPFDAPDPATGGINYSWAYDEVRAGPAIAAAGGGSKRVVAIVDTGLDVGHPDVDANIGLTYDAASGTSDVTDGDGHGTFVAGLIAAEDGNGIGGKGVAGTTEVLPVRASLDGNFLLSDVVRGLAFAIRHGADVVNLSLAGNGLDRTSARALDLAFFADVLPVAASGNMALESNPLQYPAAFLGGARGKRGIGLSVAATKPGGGVAVFSSHNDYVSVSAPGASVDCHKGVFSTIPRQPGTEWDLASPCPSTLFAQGAERWAYGQGTSFAAPIAAGIAALVWQVQSQLASEQVADVIRRSARQTLAGARWNEFTGSGIVDGEAAVALARRYDVRPPRARARARRHGGTGVSIRVRRSRDRTTHAHELAGRVRYGLLASRDGGRGYGYLVRPRRRPIAGSFALRGRRANIFIASVCDHNGNCGIRRLGRFKAR
jgi:subtilisin family serine protease